jgi:flagellar hook-length control protein FliK
MTPVFTPPLVPVVPSTLFRPTAQTKGFERLLSVSSGPVAEAPVMPVALERGAGSLPISLENVPENVAVPETEIDANILPLLAAFGGLASSEAIPVVSQSSVSAEISGPNIDRDSTQSVDREDEETVVPIPGVVSTPVISPNIVAATTSMLVLLQSAPAAAKTTEPTKVAITKGGPPVMERDVAISEPAGDLPTQAPTARQNTRPVLKQPMQDIPLLANNALAIPAADFAAILAPAAVESNAAIGAGFQAIMTDRTADTAVRPLTEASAIVAERALDVARGSLWLDQLAGDIAAVQDHDRDLSFRLVPAQLGQLDVKIASNSEGMQLNFSTQTDEAAHIIGNAQSRLVDELKAQGVRVAGSEVNSGSGQSASGQQNGSPAGAQTISEFDRQHAASSETTPTPEPQAGRFA